MDFKSLKKKIIESNTINDLDFFTISKRIKEKLKKKLKVQNYDNELQKNRIKSISFKIWLERKSITFDKSKNGRRFGEFAKHSFRWLMD